MGWQTIVKENNLDVSIVNSIDLNEELRIDAEYHKPKYLREETALLKLSRVSIGEFCFVTDGQHGYHEEDENSDIRFLTAKNAKDFFADGENVVRVAQWVDDKNKRSSLQPKDLILSTRGTVGLCAIVGNEILPAQIDQDVARICINDDADISPEFLLTYLNCSFGQDWMKRNATGNVQQGLSLDKVRKIPVPILPRDFQTRVSRLIVEAKAKTQASVFASKEAEKLLLKEINLEEYVPSKENTSVRELTECLADNRFDAEYWEPRFDEMEDRVSSIPQQELGDIVSVQKGIDPGSEAYTESGKAFVRVSDISIYGIEEGDKKISDELYEELKDNYKPKKGEVLFTKDGTIGISFALHEDIEAIVSSAFLRLEPKIKINIDYLTLVLNSLYCKFQIERMSGGAIIAHLKPESVKKIKVPVLSDAKQEELSEKATSSLRLRNEAKELLEKAKRAIEIFIEKDEQEALKYLTP